MGVTPVSFVLRELRIKYKVSLENIKILLQKKIVANKYPQQFAG